MNKSKVKILLAVVMVMAVALTFFACDDGTVSVSSIAVKEGQATSFALSDFSYNDVVFVVSFSDGNTLEKTLSKSMLSDEDKTKLSSVGTHTVKINYSGKTVDYTVTLTASEGTTPGGTVDTSTITVSFNTNGGAPSIPSISGKDSVTVESSDIATITKTNQLFGGWYTDAACTNEATFPLTTTISRTLFAKWTDASVTITFDINTNETPAPSAKTTNASSGNVITLPVGILRTGYTFDGWYKDSACTIRVTNTNKYYADTTLYAKWTPTVYTVKYMLSGGKYNGSTNPVSVPYTYGTSVVPFTPVRPGFTFVGWYDSTTEELVSFADTMPSKDLNVFARWSVEDSSTFFRYSENLDGTLTILGYADDITATEIEIPNNIGGKKVTVIGANAFSRNSYLKTFIIAEGILRIEAGAFGGCENVVSYKCSIPESVEYIGVGALPTAWVYDTIENTYNNKENNIKGVVGTILVKYQSGHSTVNIPEGITRIGPEAFKDNTALRGVIIPSTVKYIDSKAFSGAVGLNTVTFAAGSQIREVASDAFASTSWLSDRTAEVGRNNYIVFGNLLYKYLGSAVETQTMVPAGIKYISADLFAAHTKLINIDFADESAIETIGAGAFANTVWAKSRDFGVVNGILTTVLAKTNVYTYVVPSTVTTIGARAFETLRSSVDNIVLPSSVVKVEPSAFMGLVGGFNLTLEGTQPPILNDLSAFYRTSAGTTFIDVGIYVKPEALVSYQQKTENSKWGYLASVSEDTYITALTAQAILSVEGLETEYSLGSNIDVSNVRISYRTNDGLVYEDVEITISNIDDFNTDEVGDNDGLKTMYVTYRLSSSFSSSSQEVKYPVEYRVYAEVGKIEIIDNSVRLNYFQGETLNLAGGKFRAAEYQSYDSSNPEHPYGNARYTYIDAMVDDGTGRIILNPVLTINVADFDTSEITESGLLTVTYKGYTEEFTYTVAERAVQTIAVAEYYLNATGAYVYTEYVLDPLGFSVLKYTYTADDNGDYMAVYGAGSVLDHYELYDGTEGKDRFTRGVDTSRFYDDETGVIEGVRYTKNLDKAYIAYDGSAYHNTLNRYAVNPIKSVFGYLEQLDKAAVYIKCNYDQLDEEGNPIVGYLPLDNSKFRIEGFDTSAAVTDALATVYYGSGTELSCQFTYSVILRTSSDNFEYTLDLINHTAEIKGLKGNYPASIYLPETVTVEGVDYAVTSVADGAFKDAMGIDNLYITPSIAKIGEAAFKGSYIQSIHFMEGCAVTAIPKEAFMNTSMLESVTFGNGCDILSIDNYAFASSAITEIILPASVKSVGDYAFYSALNLERFSVAATSQLTDVGISAFGLCVALTDVALPDSLINMGNAMFSGCDALTTIALPANVTVLPEYIFQNCRGLQTVSMSGVQHIGANAFSDCIALTSVLGGSTIYSFGNNAFYNAVKLQTLTIDATHVETVGDGAFQQAALLNINIADATALTSIGNYAFMGTALTLIIIPANVQSIGIGAFADCAEVTEVAINSTYITTIDAGEFGGMSKLTTVTFGHENITAIGDSAFRDTAITSFDAPTGLLTIGDNAFADCAMLATVTLNEGLTSIGAYAFSDTDVLTNVTIPATVATFGNDIFAYSAIENITFAGTSVLEAIPTAAFAGSALTAITVPASVKTIGDGAFYACNDLVSFTVPALSALESIGVNAFFNDQKLATVSIGNRAYDETNGYAGTTIRESAFEGCVGIVNLVLPNSITVIEKRAFYGCTQLVSVAIGAAPTRVYEVGTAAELAATTDRYTKDEITGVYSASATGSYIIKTKYVAQEKRRSALTTIGEYAFTNTIKLSTLYITAAQPLDFTTGNNNTQGRLFGTLDVNGVFTSHFTSDDFKLHIFVNPDSNDDVDRYTTWSELPTTAIIAAADVTTVYDEA